MWPAFCSAVDRNRKALSSEIKDIFTEANRAGFDLKVKPKLIRIRKQETLLDDYRRLRETERKRRFGSGCVRFFYKSLGARFWHMGMSLFQNTFIKWHVNCL